MKALIVAILLALTLTPAHAEACKSPATKYIHAGSVGANFYVYGWCDETRFWWAYLIGADMTPARVEADAAYWLALDTGAERKPTRPLDDPLVLELWAAASTAMQYDTDRPPKVAAPIETVAKNGAYTTRPAYPVVNGQVGTKEAARATIGQPCDCTARKVMKGSTMYCAAPAPNAALVTLCRLP